MLWGMVFTAVFLVIMGGLIVKEYWRRYPEDDDDRLP